MLVRFRSWRKERVRLIEWGRAPGRAWYIRWSPSWGLGFPWFRVRKPRPGRIRVAKHHGVQLTEWRGARWVVIRQLLGNSTVKKECFDLLPKKRAR